MNKRKSTLLDPLGAEAGMYVPPPTLGDVPPPPRSLRVAALVTIAVVIVAGTVAVHTIPEARRTWQLISHQTEKALARVLGKAEQKTTEVVGGVPPR